MRPPTDGLHDVRQPFGAGPIVIVGRPHSGTRAFARLCLDNGVFLGADVAHDFLDSMGWYQRFVVPLMTSRSFPNWPDDTADEGFSRLCAERFGDAWSSYWNEDAAQSAWGWKFCETLFVMPLVKRLLPSARFLHVLRDPRDVCLSEGGFFQLTGSHRDPPGWNPAIVHGRRPTYVEFCTAVTFGRPEVAEWEGIDLRDRRALTDNRFLIQAQSWITCVSRAREYGRGLGSDYREVRYEDFCRTPTVEATTVLAFAGVDASPERGTCVPAVRQDRVEKWRRARLTLREQRDLANATELAAPMLQELGYQ